MSSDPDGITNRLWGPSAKESFNQSVKHFDKFMALEYEPPPGKDLQEDLGIPEVALVATYSNIQKSKVSYRAMDHFGKYLSKATHLRDPNQPLSMNSADRIFSAIKTGMIRDLRHEQKHNHDLMNDKAMKDIRTAMLAEMAEIAVKENRPVSNPHETSTDEDLMAIVLLCIWAATSGLAVFALYALSLKQFAGRAVETALLQFKDLSLQSPPEFPDRESIFQVFMRRTKNQVEQRMSVFVHRTKLLLCWYFMLAYMMVMMEEASASEFIFPGVAKKVDRGNDESANTQGISNYFKDVLKALTTMSTRLLQRLALVEEDDDRPTPNVKFNPKLSTHSGKKQAVNMANEHSFIKTTWVCFRAGWLMKAVHTIFDYLGFNPKSDRQVGRSLNGWITPDTYGSLGGGHPPSLAIFNGKPEKAFVKQFMRILFCPFENVVGAKDEDVQELLLATLLMRLPSFLKILQEHPEGKFGNSPEDYWAKHRFLQKLKVGVIQAGVEESKAEACLLEWGRQIEVDFHHRNFAFVEYSDLVRTQGEEPFSIDTRCMGNFFRNTNAVLWSIDSTQREQNRRFDVLEGLLHQNNTMLRKLSNENEALAAENARLRTTGNSSVAMSGTRAGVRSASELSSSSAAAAAAAVQVTSQMIPSTVTGLSVKGAVSNWYIQGWYASKGDQKRSRSIKNDIKFSVEYLALFQTRHVPPLPEGCVNGTHPTAEAWRKDVLTITGDAWEQAVALADQVGQKALTGAITTFKEWMAKLDANHWPNGPVGKFNFNPSNGAMKDRNELVEHQQAIARKKATAAAAATAAVANNTMTSEE